jgi:hypothetical protein
MQVWRLRASTSPARPTPSVATFSVSVGNKH